MSAATAQPRKKSKEPHLLTEIERQEAVLAELPGDYEFPLFDGRQAIDPKAMAAVIARMEWNEGISGQFHSLSGVRCDDDLDKPCSHERGNCSVSLR